MDSTPGPLGELPLPSDIPLQPYLALRQRLLAGSAVPAREEFAAAWDGLAFHWRTLLEHEAAFTGALSEGDVPPSADTRYVQERALAGFFFAGIAALESLAYGLFALGAVIRPDDFPLATPTDRRNATLGATLRTYGESFPDAELTRLLFWWLNSRELGWFKEVRAALAQRTSPGRAAPSLGPEAASAGAWHLHGAEMAAGTLSGKRAWLAQVVTSLVTEADSFAADRLG